MGSDQFICGTCQTPFKDLEMFMEHKRLCDEQETAESVQMSPDDRPNPSKIIDAKADLNRALSRRETREKKGDSSNEAKVVNAAPAKKAKKRKLENPIVAEDGRLQCPRCKRCFTKERSYTKHFCEQKMSGKNLLEMEVGIKPLKFEDEEEEDDVVVTEVQMEESDTNLKDFFVSEKDEDDNVKRKRRLLGPRGPRGSKHLTLEEVESLQETLSPIKPAFTSESQRRHFEEALNVDLSFVDSMFKEYYIEQDMPFMTSNTIQTSRGSDHITVFSCEQCMKVFKSLAGIRAHCLTHTDLKPYKCVECNYETNSKANLHTHWRQHTGQLYSCNICDFSSANRSHLQEHLHTHSSEKAKCKICMKLYNTQKSLINHIRKYHSDTDGVQYLNSLLVRGATSPNVAVLHRCEVCARKFKKKADRDRHAMLHGMNGSEEQMMSCEICEYKTIRNTFMASHSRKHVLVYKCISCAESVFLSSINLKEHLTEVHSNELQEKGEDAIFNECLDNSLILVDSLKQYETETENSLIEQVTTVNNLYYSPLSKNLFEKIKKENGEFECNECGKFFQNIPDLEVHNKTHFGDKPFSCDQCAFRTAHMNGLQQHKICKHKPDNIFFVCDEEGCQYAGNSQSALAHHKKTTHTTNIHLQCPKCKFTVPSVRRLKMHLSLDHSDMHETEVEELTGVARRVHNKLGRRLQKCPDDQCSKMFPMGSVELERHMWVHEGVKPFQCELCDHSCRSKANLQAHMAKHASPKAYGCGECDKAFKTKPSLNAHLRSHQSEANIDLKCEACDFVGEDLQALIDHSETHVDDNVDNSSEVEQLYKCTACDSLFKTFEEISLHVSTEHGTEETEMVFMTSEDTAPQSESNQQISTEAMIPEIQPKQEEDKLGEPKMVTFVNERGEPIDAETLASLGDLSHLITAAKEGNIE